MSIETKLAKVAVSKAAEDEGCTCECNAKAWPNVMVGLGLAAGAAVITGSILAMMSPNFSLTRAILNVYCIILSLVSMLAELRRFKAPRNLIYKIIKHVYFMTNYNARGIFYIFLGSITFDEEAVLLIIVGIFTMVVGLMLIIINCIYKLPEYLDAAEIKRRAEERMRKEIEEQHANKVRAEAAARNAASNAANNAQQRAQDVRADAAAAVGRGGYEPPKMGK